MALAGQQLWEEAKAYFGAVWEAEQRLRLERGHERQGGAQAPGFWLGSTNSLRQEQETSPHAGEIPGRPRCLLPLYPNAGGSHLDTERHTHTRAHTHAT